MFDRLLDELAALETMTVATFPAKADEAGFIDRQCPSKGCAALFKIHDDDLGTKLRGDRMQCPVCRFVAPTTEWNTHEQVRFAHDHVVDTINERLDAAIASDAAAFNAERIGGGWLQMSIEHTPEHRSPAILAAAERLMQQRYACARCACRYATRGAAFFCPACGHHSARQTFTDTLTRLRETLARIRETCAAIAVSQSEDAARDLERLLVETTVSKLVATFQSFAALEFAALPNAPSKLPKNVFQRFDESSTLWRAAIGVGYEDLVDAPTIATLKRTFQQRHLLEHCGGIVDPEYLAKAHDPAYVAGQRLVIGTDLARVYVAAFQQLSDALVGRLPNAVPAP